MNEEIKLYDTVKETSTGKLWRVIAVDGDELKIRRVDHENDKPKKGRPRIIDKTEVNGVDYKKLSLPPVTVSKLEKDEPKEVKEVGLPAEEEKEPEEKMSYGEEYFLPMEDEESEELKEYRRLEEKIETLENTIKQLREINAEFAGTDDELRKAMDTIAEKDRVVEECRRREHWYEGVIEGLSRVIENFVDKAVER